MRQDEHNKDHQPHSLEFNKIFAAILFAGIVAYLAWFVSDELIHPHVPEKAVIEIDTSALEAANAGGAAAPTGPEPILAMLEGADAAKGEALAKACLACHGFEKGGPNKVGPNLYGIVNNAKAHKADFAYSDTIKEMAAKGDHWTYQNLNAFLYKPSGYAPGTKMSFPGLKKAQDRANVIAYLRTVADAPAAMPSQADIAAEAPAEKPIEEKKDEAAAKAVDATQTATPGAKTGTTEKTMTPEQKNPAPSAGDTAYPTKTDPKAPPAKDIPGGETTHEVEAQSTDHSDKATGHNGESSTHADPTK